MDNTLLNLRVLARILSTNFCEMSRRLNSVQNGAVKMMYQGKKKKKVKKLTNARTSVRATVKLSPLTLT